MGLFRTIQNLGIGFLSLFVRGVASRNPRALLAAEKERFRDQISKLEGHIKLQAGACERLRGQVTSLKKKEEEALRSFAAHAQLGHTEAAGQYANQVKFVREQLSENQTQLDQNEKIYEDLRKTLKVTVRDADAKFRELQGKIDQAEIMEASAEMNRMAAGLVNEVAGSEDSFGQIAEIVEEKHTKAAGALRYSKDSLNMDKIELKESEQKALGQMEAAKLAAELGISIPAPAKTDAAQPSLVQPPPKQSESGKVM